MAKSIFVISPWTGRIGPNTFLEGFVDENLSSGNSLTILYPFGDDISAKFQRLGCTVIFNRLLTLRSFRSIYFKMVYRLIIESLLFFVFSFHLVKNRYNSCLVNTELFSFSLIIPSLIVKVIVVVHSLSFSGNYLTRLIFCIQQKAVHQYIAVSEAVKYALLEVGVSTDIRRVYNGLVVDKELGSSINPEQTGKVEMIAIIHSLPHKGAHYLLEVLDLVIQEEKNIHCAVVGWGSSLHDKQYKKLIEDRAANLGLNEYITFKGITDNIKAEYKEADIMVHPSESESFGYVIVEAMANEIPVIAFRVGGIPEIIEDGLSGLLIEPFDTRAMASGLLSLIKDKQRRKEFGIRGKQIVNEKFDLKKNMSEIVGML